MSNFGLSCDSCGRGVQGITWVNGMKFCAKCYQETFGASKDWQLLDKDKTIAEQQQRLAELEEQLKNATKQVRKEVVQEIKKLMQEKKGVMIGRYNYQTAQHDEVEVFELGDLNKVLNKIIGELNGKVISKATI